MFLTSNTTAAKKKAIESINSIETHQEGLCQPEAKL